MTQTSGLDAFTEFNRGAVIGVGLPVMIMAGIATHFNSRASIARQSPEAAANPQTAIMNRLMLYVFPFGVVVGGPFLPIAIIFYWFANNIWTFGQQHYVFGKIEKRKRRRSSRRRSGGRPTRPPPGAKPNRARKAPPAATEGPSDAEADGDRVGHRRPGRVEHRHAEWWAVQRPTPHRGQVRLRAPARGPRNGNADRSSIRWMRERQT